MQFIRLGEDRDALVVNGGGGFHVWDHIWIYPLAPDGIPENPQSPLLDVRGELVEVQQEGRGVTVVRHFACFGGGPCDAQNTYRWNGQRFTYDAQLSNRPEVGQYETMVEQ